MLNDIYHALSPIAFYIGPFAIRWYGLGYLAGIIIGGIIVYLTAKHWKIRLPADVLLTIILASALGIIIGGRLGYVLFYGNGYYFAHPLEVFAVSNGGMSFHGGVIGMVVALAIVSKVDKIPLLTLGDLIVIGAPVGIFLVRCANFINGERWGAVTNLPWGVVFGGSAGNLPRQPSQLYEAVLEGLVIFIVMMILSRKVPARPRGTFAGTFMLLYGIFRIAVEFVRQPDAQIGYLFGGWLTMGMVLSAPLVILGVIFLVYAHKKKKPQLGVFKKVEGGVQDAPFDQAQDAKQDETQEPSKSTHNVYKYEPK
ncbi:MAG: prolipoprotein diacylglyceryl transferase [Coriobacteriales bacterium]|jgi:phosphatidylglycerol:prolipoprotein diacylglycerol transferase|nr:prolipoprotein diacylglyceryl transferase [Coriobacteriales bacterium]